MDFIALIDADVLTYQVGYGTEEDSEDFAVATLDGFITDLMLFDLHDVYDFEFYLTGKDVPNFRYSIAVTQPYKGNRKNNKPPQHLKVLRNRLIEYWGAILSVGEEADDLISKRMTELKDQALCVTIDKDLDTVPGWHYNFRKEERYYVDDFEAQYNFYTQLLVGDRVDNIQGVFGVGPKKAEKLLDGLITPKEMWDACVKAHGSYERALEDARLLHMRRKDLEIWEPPT